MRRVLTDFGTREGAKAQKYKNLVTWRLGIRIFHFLLLALMIPGGKMTIAQSDISARIVAIQPAAHLGEAVELMVTVDHPAGWRVIAPQLAEVWGDFEVRSQSVPVVTAAGDGRESSHFSIVVTAWELGKLNTLALPLTVSNPQGELVEVTADSVTIQVESVLMEDDLALRDIKPQATLPLPVWWPWLAGVLGLVSVLGVLWWRGRGGETAVPFVDSRLPHQIALDRLDRIAASGLAEQGNFKSYYTETTDVLRRYLDEMWNLKTEEQTTAEIRQAIQPFAWGNEAKKLLVNLLNEADLVKFAKVRPSVTDARRATDEAKRLVLAVKDIRD